MASNSDQPSKAQSTATIVRAVVFTLILVLLAVFALSNTEETPIDFLVTETEAPLFVVLLATAVVGALLATLIRWKRSD